MDLSAPQIALLSLAALVAGTIDAVAGGGGLVTLPALLAAGLPPQLALGTNKGQSVFGSFAAMVRYARAGVLDPRRARLGFPLGLAGSLLGAQLVLWIRPALLRPIVLGLLPLATALVVLRPASRVAARPHANRRRPAADDLIAAALAFGIAAYDGFFGPGTGTFLILGYVGLLGATLVTASADAKVVNFASNLAAVLLFASRGVVLWRVALPMAAAQFAGGLLGAHLTLRGGNKLVRGVLVMVVAALLVKLGWDLLA